MTFTFSVTDFYQLSGRGEVDSLRWEVLAPDCRIRSLTSEHDFFFFNHFIDRNMISWDESGMNLTPFSKSFIKCILL